MSHETKHSPNATVGKTSPSPEATIGQASELAHFGHDRFGATTLFESSHVRVLLVAFEPGQAIPLHAPAVDLVVVAVDGVGELLAGDRVVPLRTGTVAVVPAGQKRGIRARSARLVLITMVTPPPGQADHAPVAGARWPRATEPAQRPAALIRAEHAAMRPDLDDLGALADDLDACDEPVLRARLERVLAFLRDGVLAHAGVEEATIYPAVAELLRALGGATGTMILEHESIAARVEKLAGLAAADRYDARTRAELRRELIGLEAVLRGHFDKEERVYVPLLDHLSAVDADALVGQLDHAPVKGHGH